MPKTITDKVPHISEELIDWLIAKFPETALAVDDAHVPTTDAVVVHGLLRAGEQRVIKHLASLHKRQGQ